MRGKVLDKPFLPRYNFSVMPPYRRFNFLAPHSGPNVHKEV